MEAEEPQGSFFENCQEIKWFLMGRSSHYMFGSKPYGVCAELILRDMIKYCKGNHSTRLIQFSAQLLKVENRSFL